MFTIHDGPTVGAQKKITEHWNSRSAAYDDSPGHSLCGDQEKSAWLRTLEARLPPAPAEVLDAGTGTGFLALLLAEMGYFVTGVDLAEDMLVVARRKRVGLDPQPAFVLGNAAGPMWPAHSFDVIVSRHLLWTLIDPRTTFTSWFRLLRPGGRVLAFDSVRTESPAPTSTGYREELRESLPFGDVCSTESVLSVFEAAGFITMSADRMREIEQAQRAADPATDTPGSAQYAYVASRPTSDQTGPVQ